MTSRVRGLPPIIGEGAKVLVLGTMPGRESLARQQYYANPRNAFWKIVEPWSGAPSTPYETRCAGLIRAGVALWDVLAECDRDGSSDSSITGAIPNDLSGLLGRGATLRHVLFNGQTARSLFDRCGLFAPALVELITMPSTSPANARAGKVEAWRATLVRTLVGR
jgi:hypoxanthine-DNA glycosylase